MKIQNLHQFVTTTPNTNNVSSNRSVKKNFLRNRIHFYYTEPPLSTDFDIMDKIVLEDESDFSIGIFSSDLSAADILDIYHKFINHS